MEGEEGEGEEGGAVRGAGGRRAVIDCWWSWGGSVLDEGEEGRRTPAAPPIVPSLSNNSIPSSFPPLPLPLPLRGLGVAGEAALPLPLPFPPFPPLFPAFSLAISSFGLDFEPLGRPLLLFVGVSCSERGEGGMGETGAGGGGEGEGGGGGGGEGEGAMEGETMLGWREAITAG